MQEFLFRKYRKKSYETFIVCVCSKKKKKNHIVTESKDTLCKFIFTVCMCVCVWVCGFFFLFRLFSLFRESNKKKKKILPLILTWTHFDFIFIHVNFLHHYHDHHHHHLRCEKKICYYCRNFFFSFFYQLISSSLFRSFLFNFHIHRSFFLSYEL